MDGLVLEQEFLVVKSVEPGLHGDGLHEVVGFLAGETFVDEGGHDALREDDFIGYVYVFQHVVREDDEVFQDFAEAVEHVVQQNGGVREHDTLGGGVGDVALVPQGNVFVGAHHVAPEDARAPAHVLAADGIALVRHGGGAFLSFAKSLFGFAQFGSLPVANFHGHLLHSGADESQSGHVVCMSVALEHLRGDVGGVDAQLLADVVLHKRRCVGEVAHGPADLAAFHIGGGSFEAGHVALHLFVPQSPFQSQ